MKFKKILKLKNKGFSLNELLIYMSIVGLLMGVTVYNYNGSRTKAVALLSMLDDIKTGYTSFYSDMKCRPQTISQLVTAKDLEFQGPDGMCDADDIHKWNGPYIRLPLESQSKDVGGFYDVIMPGTLNYSEGGYSSINSYYDDNSNGYISYISLHNLPGDISDEIMKICNGIDDNGKYKTGGKCVLGDSSYNIVNKADHDKKYDFMFFTEGSPESAGFFGDDGDNGESTIQGA